MHAESRTFARRYRWIALIIATSATSLRHKIETEAEPKFRGDVSYKKSFWAERPWLNTNRFHLLELLGSDRNQKFTDLPSPCWQFVPNSDLLQLHSMIVWKISIFTSLDYVKLSYRKEIWNWIWRNEFFVGMENDLVSLRRNMKTGQFGPTPGLDNVVSLQWKYPRQLMEVWANQYRDWKL